MLLLFFTIYLLTAFVWPSWRVWRATGINPIVLPKDDSAYGFLGGVFRVVIGSLFVVLLLETWQPGLLAAYFPAFPLLQGPGWRLTGWILLLLAWLWTVLAQYQMQSSWRIGIDYAQATPLVVKGMFRYSRNPIFLGMLLALTGVLLILPNAIVLTVLVAGYVAIAVQVRLEEVFLQEQHGTAYQTYRARTRRWFGTR